MSIPVLDIPLQPSRIFAVSVIFLYSLTGVLLAVSSMAFTLKILLLCVLLGLGWHVRRKWQLLSSIQRLQVLPQAYRLVTANGEMELAGGHQTLVSNGLVILHLRDDKRALHLPLLQDSAATEDLRRLRVWLRCGK